MGSKLFFKRGIGMDSWSEPNGDSLKEVPKEDSLNELGKEPNGLSLKEPTVAESGPAKSLKLGDGSAKEADIGCDWRSTSVSTEGNPRLLRGSECAFGEVGSALIT
jgi:hypothetical protein